MEDVAHCVGRAAGGDAAAWDDLVERFSGLVWSVARSHGLDHADANEVSQTTWLRLAEHIDALVEPARIGAWLTTTARREAIRVGRLGNRQVLVDPWDLVDRVDDEALAPESALITEEDDLLVRQALALLSARCRDLITRLVMSDAPPSYTALSAESGIAVGSIGPIRGRCLDRLRRLLDEVGLDTGTTALGRSTR